MVVRADADSRIGLGHVARCTALTSAWIRRGGSVTFVTATTNPQVLERIGSTGTEVVNLEGRHPDPADMEGTLSVLGSNPGGWAVLDGYNFDTAYQRRVRCAAGKLMFIDDDASLGHYVADVLLNQNISAESLGYSVEPYTEMLLGTRYVMLSDGFVEFRDRQRAIPEEAKRVLVTMGGSDPDNQTLKVVRAIGRLGRNDLEVTVVLGATNLNREALEYEFAGMDGLRLLQGVDNMPELMEWADLAVSGGGSTCWELAYMGLPNLVLVLAPNQVRNVDKLRQAGVTESLGWFELVTESVISEQLVSLIFDSERRAEMSCLGSKLVDGLGTERVVDALGRVQVRAVC